MPRLFSLPDGVLDAKDRASWLTPPFDTEFGDVTGEGAATLSAITGAGVAILYGSPPADVYFRGRDHVEGYTQSRTRS